MFVQQWGQDRRLCLETTRTNWAPPWETSDHLGVLDSTLEPAACALEQHSNLSVRMTD